MKKSYSIYIYQEALIRSIPGCRSLCKAVLKAHRNCAGALYCFVHVILFVDQFAHMQGCASRCSCISANQLPVGATDPDTSMLPHRKPCFTAPNCSTCVINSWILLLNYFYWKRTCMSYCLLEHQCLWMAQLQRLLPGYIAQHRSNNLLRRHALIWMARLWTEILFAAAAMLAWLLTAYHCTSCTGLQLHWSACLVYLI